MIGDLFNLHFLSVDLPAVWRQTHLEASWHSGGRTLSCRRPHEENPPFLSEYRWQLERRQFRDEVRFFFQRWGEVFCYSCLYCVTRFIWGSAFSFSSFILQAASLSVFWLKTEFFALKLVNVKTHETAYETTCFFEDKGIHCDDCWVLLLSTHFS